jgi:hypothetical protein
MYENLDNKLALLYAARAYDNPQCITKEEFTEDYKRFKYVKRLCRRYITTHKLGSPTEFGSERLLLNHLILLANVFGVQATVRLLFLKCDSEKLWRVLKPFLWHLKYLPRIVMGINGVNIDVDKIPLDEKLLQRIRELCSNDSMRG